MKIGTKFEILLILIFLMILSNCKHRESNLNEKEELSGFQLPVDLSISNRDIKVSEFADSVWYVPLETNDECLLSELNKDVKYVNGEFYIVDDKSTTIYRFSNQGKFLGKVGKKGNGPHEFFHYHHFAVADSFVYVVDFGKKVHKYLKDGSFVSDIFLAKQPYRIIALNNDRIACYITDNQFVDYDSRYDWLIINSRGDSLACCKTPMSRENQNKENKMLNYYVVNEFSTDYPFSYKEAFNDSLYSFTSNSFQTKVFGYIDQGVHKIDQEMTFEEVLQQKHAMRISRLYDTPTFLFMVYACLCRGNSMFLAAIDKKNGVFYNVLDSNNTSKITNDMGGPNFKPLTCVYPGLLIGFAEAFDCEDDFRNKYHFGEDNNPILVMIKCK